MVYNFRVGSYARAIYLDGIRKMVQAEAEDAGYRLAIEQYAAKNFFYDQIDNALAKSYIDQITYNETIALREAIISRDAEVIPMASQTTTEI